MYPVTELWYQGCLTNDPQSPILSVNLYNDTDNNSPLRCVTECTDNVSDHIRVTFRQVAVYYLGIYLHLKLDANLDAIVKQFGGHINPKQLYAPNNFK